MTKSPREQLDRQKFSLWISAVNLQQNFRFAETRESLEDDKLRLGIFSLKSAAEFQHNNPKFTSAVSHCLLLWLLLSQDLTRWYVACTDWEWGSHHAWEGCSPMVREEFTRHAELSES